MTTLIAPRDSRSLTETLAAGLLSELDYMASADQVAAQIRFGELLALASDPTVDAAEFGEAVEFTADCVTFGSVPGVL
jgi:hypothetical protein